MHSEKLRSAFTARCKLSLQRVWMRSSCCATGALSVHNCLYRASEMRAPATLPARLQRVRFGANAEAECDCNTYDPSGATSKEKANGLPLSRSKWRQRRTYCKCGAHAVRQIRGMRAQRSLEDMTVRTCMVLLHVTYNSPRQAFSARMLLGMQRPRDLFPCSRMLCLQPLERPDRLQPHRGHALSCACPCGARTRAGRPRAT